MTDLFTEGPIDPRIYKELATDMWREAVSYLSVKDVLKLPDLCKYFNEEVVWHKHSGRLLWGEMPHIDERVFTETPIIPPHETALMRACRRGAKITHITCLLNGGANVNAIQRLGWTALYLASAGGYEGIVRALLGANANPNIATNSCWTPLLAASYRGRPSVVSALIQGGANINHVSFGQTALMWACMENHVDCVRLLVNANVNMRNNDEKTALDIARYYNRHDIVRILEEALEQSLEKAKIN